MGGEDDKITRVPGETLSIKVTPEEETYRKKYLPDAKKLTDEKLVCTVCSASLAQTIHKGKDLYIHRALQVLVCEACYNFYGDGCFSADEDGDDKYCRWCGQGGSLYLCAKCNCAFCQKCTKQNLKASVLAELENDDWKCYICNPRPLFGCRTICWGAQQLNQIGKEKEAERLKKVKEKLEQLEKKRKEDKERKSRKTSTSEDDALKKKRKKSSDEESSSPEVFSVPKKRRIETRDNKGNRNMNGSVGRRKKDSSSDSDSEEDRKVTRHSRSCVRKEKIVESSSDDDEFESKRKKDKLKKKKKSRDNSDESTDSGKNRSKRSTKKKDSSDESSSEDEKSKRKSKSSIKKRADSSDSSNGVKKKKKLKKNKTHTSSEDSSEDARKKNKKISKKKPASSSESEEDEVSKRQKKSKCKPEKGLNKKKDGADSDNESNKNKKSNADTEEPSANSTEDLLVKKRIKLAILWLSTMVKDISELGTLISLRATNFSKKKINSDNLKSYEDVLKCVRKIKQLITGVHSNYDHIEKTLESHLKPWKILTGLDDPDNEKNLDGETSMGVGDEVLKTNEKTVKLLVQTSQETEVNGTPNKSNIDSSVNKNSENLNNWSDDSNDDQETRAMVSKARECLDNSQIDDSKLKSKCLEDINKDGSEKLEGKISQEESSPERNGMDTKTTESKSEDSKGLTPKETSTKESTLDSLDGSSKTNKDSKAFSETEDSSQEKSSPEKKKSKEGSEEEDKKTNFEGDRKNNRNPRALHPVSRKDSTKEDHKFRPVSSRLKKKRESEMNLKNPVEIESNSNEGKEKLVPKVILKPLKIEGSEESELENVNNSQAEDNNKKENVEDSNSEEEGVTLKKSSKKISRKSANKNDTDEKKSNCLSSSDEEVKKSTTKTKNKHGKKKVSKEESDEDDLNESTAVKRTSKSKSSRKGKLQESNSEDEESMTSKKMKLKKLKEIEDKDADEAMDEDEEREDKLNSKCEENDGSKVDVEKQLNGKTIEKGLSELEADNNEDVEMVQDQEIKCENIVEDNGLEETSESSATKEVVENCGEVDPKDEIKNKFVGLDSSSDEEVVTKAKKKEATKKKAVKTQKKTRNVLVLSSDDEVEEPTNIESSEEDNEKDEKDEDFAVVLDSSAHSSDSEIITKNKRKKKSSSDSDASISGEEKVKKKKRRRVKCADSSNESGESDDEKKKDGESPTKGGRKNIKKIKKKGDLEQTTIEAAEEEKERRRRIEERQKLFNQVFEVKQSTKLEQLVLDFDPDSKKELISVNKDLVAKMKPHQAKGVKFMWDSCFESVKQIKKTKGSGCILAHCMGLGKTFQVVSLVHTLLTHEEYTKVRTVMVVCPLSTVLNWVNEFGKWLDDVEGGDEIEVFHLTKYNKNPDRARELRRWQHNGGVLIMGYEMFRNLTNETTKKFKAKMKKDFLETLINPGADLIVCDEGHMLKNEATALSKAMTRVKTLRRIVLTGTPMQNNLKEYHCMVQFVKPNLLGTSKEFLNRFVNPINNGQFVDSTDHDVKLMKRRAHVLHKMLEGLVQRFDYNVLTPFLPPKQEYVISVCLSELQEKLYSYYLDNQSQKAEGMKGGTRLFMDWQTLGRVWTHPRVLKMSTDKANWLKEKKAMEESDSEGSLVDFIDDDSEKSTTTEDSSEDFSDDDSSKKKKSKATHRSRSTRSTRQSSNVALLESSDEEKLEKEKQEGVDSVNQGEWWTSFVEPQHFEDMRQSGKLLLLFAILKECEMIEDKVLVFSQSLFSLDLIEYFLDKIDCATQEGKLDENLDNHQGTWSKGLDYFRLDGSTSSENRNIWCKAFNREDNPRARLFLISTRAGGLGINLTAANRVIIFDASWNPSHDIQSIFRIYRFGQKKPCYVYRFVAFGTMEEKVYERQVAKQSISNRVVDEQQVHRHFSMNDLTELYTFTPASKLEDRPTPALPRDPLMTEILSQMKAWIEKYHEHDSLLENVVEEELNEEERKAAWEDYENDKKRGFMPPAGPQGPSMAPSAAWNQQIELMRQQLKLRYANKSDDEINQILVYQVSLLMRQQQQQQMQMMQAANNMGNMGFRPQMYGANNMMQQGGFNQRPQLQTTAYLRNIAPKPTTQQYQDQVYRMQQQANLARLQMQQMSQQKSQQAAKAGQSLLGAQLTSTSGKYPTANITAQLQKMKQNYQDSRAAKPGVVITEIFDDKPSGSSES